jgi:hypothetical protein
MGIKQRCVWVRKIDMKKISILLLLIIAVGIPAFAQEVNVDSIIKVVVATNSAQKSNPILNKDSLFKRLPVTTQAAQG